MSYEAAVGQIDQILQWQQQILDPATATQSAASSGANSSTSTEDSAFASALAEAQGSAADEATGITDSDSDTELSGLLGGGDSELLSLLSSAGSESTTSTDSTLSGVADTGGVATGANSRVAAMIEKADSLLGKPYVWGGGHDGWGSQAGYDCSGFVSAVLHAGGYLSAPQDTETLPSAAGIESGPGKYVTIYDRDESGEQGHVIIDIDGQFYESGGEHGAWGGGGGVEKIATPTAAYLATFNDILHPSGL